MKPYASTDRVSIITSALHACRSPLLVVALFSGVINVLMLSGSFTRPVWAAKGDTLHADFGPLGSVSVQFV